MNSKKGFANITRTGKNIGESSGLNSFITNKDQDQETKEKINKETKPKEQEKKVTEQPKPKEKVPEKKQKTEDLEEKVSPDLPHKKESASLDFLTRYDFKAHSVLFSKSQLDELRNYVNFKKWKDNPKFSIQLVIFEALKMLMDNRVKVNNFPDDFVPYTISFSQDQWNELDSFVDKVSNLEYGRYGKKHAVYEAVKTYLDKHPIQV